MGNTTASYRWFALAYIISVFVLIPAAVFSLSLAGIHVFLGVFIPIFIVIIIIIIINYLQKRCPSRLPVLLQTWGFLPKPLRSLQLCDACIQKCCCRLRFCRRVFTQEEEDVYATDVLFVLSDDLLRVTSQAEIIETLEVGEEAQEQET